MPRGQERTQPDASAGYRRKRDAIDPIDSPAVARSLGRSESAAPRFLLILASVALAVCLMPSFCLFHPAGATKAPGSLK